MMARDRHDDPAADAPVCSTAGCDSCARGALWRLLLLAAALAGLSALRGEVGWAVIAGVLVVMAAGVWLAQRAHRCVVLSAENEDLQRQAGK